MERNSVNTFNKGMNQDLGKTIPQDGSYLEGRNIRIIANESPEESGIVVNVEGNSKSFELQYQCTTCYSLWEQTGSQGIYATNFLALPHTFIKIGEEIYIVKPDHTEGVGGTVIPADEQDLQSLIKSGRDLVLCTREYLDELIALGNWKAMYVNLADGLWLDLPEFEGYDTPEEVYEESPAFITQNFYTYDPDYDGLQIPPIDGERLCDAYPIGWTTIRDSLYIFAANNARFNPGKIFENKPGGLKTSGFIFRVDFNPITNVASAPVEVYSHPELNFSMSHPIEAIGRYENEEMKRLYWTDNFNTVRTINIAAPNIWDLTPKDLQLSPDINFSAPVVEGILNGGSLPAGMYQYAYRLKNTGGAETKFSIFTNFLHIVQAAEGADYWNYTDDPEDITEYNGSEPGAICSKSVRLKVEGIDQSYDIIEFAAIYKSGPEGIANSYVFDSRKITGTDMRIVHQSNTDIVSLISLAELTAFTYTIKRAKTIATKDNRLFLGNVIAPYNELVFNARAYRYKRDDGRIYNLRSPDQGGVTTYCDPHFDPYTTPEYVEGDEYAVDNSFSFSYQDNMDAINPYNVDMIQSIANPNFSYKYQQDGVTLGGQGPYIKYSFIKKALSGDKFVGGSNPAANNPPFVDIRNNAADCDDASTFIDYKNPLVTEKFKGYQRDEVYRFGIVLYDKQGNPGFVNWIGDIRFPRYKDIDKDGLEGHMTYTLSATRKEPVSAWDGTVPTSGEEWMDSYFNGGSHSGTTITVSNGEVWYSDQPQWQWDFEGNDIGTDSIIPESDFYPDDYFFLSMLGANGGGRPDINYHYLYALGIKFDVSIPAELKDFVSGYSIVRVKREEMDKTVLGVGIGHWMYRWDIKEDGDKQHLSFRASMNTWEYNNSYKSGEIRHHAMSMDAPDFAFTGDYPQAGPCDWVEIVGWMSTGGSSNAYENDFLAGQGRDDDFYRKFYGHGVIYRDTMSENNAELIEVHGQLEVDPDSTGSNNNSLNGDFFKPRMAIKMGAGEKLPSNVMVQGSIYYGAGVQNIGVFTDPDDDTNVRTYSIGCESLLIDFDGIGFIKDANGNLVQWQPGYNFFTSNNLIPPNVLLAYPYWKLWLVGTPISYDTSNNPISGGNGAYFDMNAKFFSASGSQFESIMNGTLEDTTLSWNTSSVQINGYSTFKYQDKPLLAWRRERTNKQYGGPTYEDRSRNSYIGTGSFIPFPNTRVGQTIKKVDYTATQIDEEVYEAIPFDSVDVWGGDTFVHFYDMQKLRRRNPDNGYPDNQFGNDTNKAYNVCYAFPTESTLNLSLRTGHHFANKAIFTEEQDAGDPIGDEYEYQSVYSAQNDLRVFYTRPFNYINRDVFDSRILYSDEKSNGDLADSWRTFRMDNYRDIDSAYGPINKLIIHQENLYAFQDRAVNMLMINPTAITTTTDQSALILGTGAVIQDDKYISKEIGSKHQWSILSTPKGLYWVDILTNAIYKISGQGIGELSRIKGLKNYFEATLESSPVLPDTYYDNVNGTRKGEGDNPILRSGIVTGFDAKNNEVLFSFLERRFVVMEHGKRDYKVAFAETVAYSETTQTFTSIYDFGTGMFINTQDKLLSLYPSDFQDGEYYRYEGNRLNEFYLHNHGNYGNWYDIYFDSSIDFIVNKFPTETKVFDNLEWHTEALINNSNISGSTWDKMSCRTDYQNNQVLFLTPEEFETALVDDPNFSGVINLKRRERTWKTHVPRNKGRQGERLRDKYLKILLSYDNSITENEKLRCHYVKTKFRVSKR